MRFVVDRRSRYIPPYELVSTELKSSGSANFVRRIRHRYPHPKIDKLACQTKCAGILADGETNLRDAYCLHIWFFAVIE